MPVDKPIDLLLAGQLLSALSLLILGFVFLRLDSDHSPSLGFAWAALAISIMSLVFTSAFVGQESATKRRRIEDERGKINCLANLEYLKSKGRDTSGMRCEGTQIEPAFYPMNTMKTPKPTLLPAVLLAALLASAKRRGNLLRGCQRALRHRRRTDG